MNVDRIFEALNACGVEYLVIGGMNYMLRHEPVLTYDVDIWIRDTDDNRARCEQALSQLGASWGESEDDWGPVKDLAAGWLGRQALFCLTSPEGSIDVFREVRGIDDWVIARAGTQAEQTAAGVPYFGLSDADMLRSQLALDASGQKQDRIRRLEEAVGGEEEGIIGQDLRDEQDGDETE